MGAPLSPIEADIFMENLEEKAILKSFCKPDWVRLKMIIFICGTMVTNLRSLSFTCLTPWIQNLNLLRNYREKGVFLPQMSWFTEMMFGDVTLM